LHWAAKCKAGYKRNAMSRRRIRADRPLTNAEHLVRWRARQAEKFRRENPDWSPYLSDEAAAKMWDKIGLPALETEPVAPVHSVMVMPIMELPSPEAAERLRRALTKPDDE
jgi:hypothetical protein